MDCWHFFKTRYNILLPRQTMARWMAMIAFWLTGIWKEIEKEVLADGYVECDEPKRSGDSQPICS